MAKQKGIIKLSGLHKASYTVFVNGKNGTYTRSAPVAGRRKDEPAFKQQHIRSKYLNPLAGKINTAFACYAGAFKDSALYHTINACFRKEPENIRILLLDELKELEINKRYAFNKLCPEPIITVASDKTSITIEVELKQHVYTMPAVNSYYLQFIILTWNSIDEICIHNAVKTAWISMQETLPLYCALDFERPVKSTDYLVACRCVTGWNNYEDGTFPLQGMKVIGVGSLDKKINKLLLKKREAKRIAAIPKPKEAEVVEKRVEMRRKK